MNATSPTPAPKTLRLALCGDCARARLAKIVGGLEMIRPCEGNHGGGAPAATALCEVAALEGAPTERPHLELVEFAPATLDAATHAKQALDLLAAWTRVGEDDRVPIADEWTCEQAVATVATVHRIVQARKK